MNKKLVLAAALVFAFAGLMLSHTVKAQDATDNSTNSDNSAMNADNSAAPAPAAQ